MMVHSPCEPADVEFYCAALQHYLPVWNAQRERDGLPMADPQAFIVAHREQVAADPTLCPMFPADFARLSQHHERLQWQWKYARDAHQQLGALAADDVRQLMADEAAAEREHPTVKAAVQEPSL